MKTCNTWLAYIFCGLREEYSGSVHPIEFIYEICQRYVDVVGWCVTVTSTRYIYKGGQEPGAIIGIIAYPRFPLSVSELEKRAIDLAKELKVQLKQARISVSFPDRTIMLENEKR